jgi:hypothetical protein
MMMMPPNCPAKLRLHQKPRSLANATALLRLSTPMQGVLHKDNRDLAIMLDGEGDAVPMAVITA